MTPEFRGVIESGHSEQDEAPFGVSIVFPRSAACDANAAMDRLFGLFPDHEPILLSEFEDRWIFELNWASDPRTFVDPGVISVAGSLHGLSRSEIGGYRELHSWGGRDVVVSMVHSWALLAPAKAIARRANQPLYWVVHLDDHTDLMASLAKPLSRPGSLRDCIFREDIELGDSDSVVHAVKRGTVSKGNFLTAYLLAYPGCRAVHVDTKLTERAFQISRQMEVLELGGGQLARHGFVLKPVPRNESWTFRQVRSLPIDLPVGEHEGVWLDIDLDYFWNRYNGDSDRCFEVPLPGERDEVMRRVNHFLDQLRNATWLNKIEAVSIAVSPGFFPSEYWADVIMTVRNEIQYRLEA